MWISSQSEMFLRSTGEICTPKIPRFRCLHKPAIFRFTIANRVAIDPKKPRPAALGMSHEYILPVCGELLILGKSVIRHTHGRELPPHALSGPGADQFRRLPGRCHLQPAEDRKALSRRMNRAASEPHLPRPTRQLPDSQPQYSLPTVIRPSQF